MNLKRIAILFLTMCVVMNCIVLPVYASGKSETESVIRDVSNEDSSDMSEEQDEEKSGKEEISDEEESEKEDDNSEEISSEEVTSEETSQNPKDEEGSGDELAKKEGGENLVWEDLLPYRDFSLDSSTIYIGPEYSVETNNGEHPALQATNFSRELLDKIYNALKNREEEILVDEYRIHRSNAGNLLRAVTYTYPEILFEDPIVSGTCYYSDSEILYRIKFMYLNTPEESWNLRVACSRIFSGIESGMSMEQKLVYLYESMIKTTQRSMEGENKYTSYGALVDKKAYSSGYAAAFELLTRLQGFETKVVYSSSLAHSWNLIVLDGAEYFLDCYWDDNDLEFECCHGYLLKSRDAIRSSYPGTDWTIGGESAYNRAINSTKYDNYYWNEVIHPLCNIGNIQAYAKQYEVNNIYIGTRGSERVIHFPVKPSWRNYQNNSDEVSSATVVKAGNNFYVNSNDAIYQLTTGGKISLYYQATGSEKKLGHIWGLTCNDNKTLTYYIGKSEYLITYKRNITANLDMSRVYNRFRDVKKDAWYVDVIQYVYDNGIMSGKEDKFGPNDPVKREQVTQILYNNCGKPAVGIANPFTDVYSGEYYYNSVLWAKQMKIAAGKPDGTFGVGKNIIREDLAVLLYNYAKYRDFASVSNINHSAINGFKDTARVDSYAKTAMNWAVTNGILSGKGTKGAAKSNLSLDPHGNATRAECAAMMKKLLGN